MKFSDKYLQGLKPKEKRYEVLESDGLTIRVYPTGKKTFRYVFKEGGRNKALTIGSYPAVTLKEAREKHRGYLSLRSKGEPLVVKDEMTYGDLIADYLEKYAKPKKKSWRIDRRILNKDGIDIIGKNTQITKITKRDIIQVIEEIESRGAKYQATQSFLIINRMFGYAVEKDYLSLSPCYGVKSPWQTRKKTRVLDCEEIKRLWYGLDGTRTFIELIGVLRLILVTAQRPGECLNIRWDEIDGDWWTIPGKKTKNKKDHRVWLSPLAKMILCERGKGYVFASPKSAKHKPPYPTALPKVTERLCSSSEMQHFTPHDLRRTAATHIAELGFSDFVVGRILNHTEKSVTSIYNRYSYDKEKQAALAAWSDKLVELLGLTVP